jgi:hypothetical protein
MATKFAIFRCECSGGYSTRGPVVPEMTLEEARKEITRLKTAYPQQDFVIMAEMGTVSRSERVTVRIEAPDISKRVRKRVKSAFTPNVIPIRKGESG